MRTPLAPLACVLSTLGAPGCAVLCSKQIDCETLVKAKALNLQQTIGLAAASDMDLGDSGYGSLVQAWSIEERDVLRQPARLQTLMNSLWVLAGGAWVGGTDAPGKVLAAPAGRLLGMRVSEADWWDMAQEGLLEPLLHALQMGKPWRFIDLTTPPREDGRLPGCHGPLGHNWT